MSRVELLFKQDLPETKFPSFKERIIDYVETEVSQVVAVLIEGPPIYLWPNERYPSQQWTSQSFEEGWRLLNDITRKIPVPKSNHFFLLDDFNNAPSSSAIEVQDERLLTLKLTSKAFASSQFFDCDGSNRRIYKESDFLREDCSNRCSNLDASFQKEKLLFFIHQKGLSLDELRDLLFVVVHPVDFCDQQSLMLSSLLGEMKKPPLNRLSKIQRRDLISGVYRHIWTNESGEVIAVTKPVWDGSKFVFEEIEI